jgi:hypothetical protein
MWFELYVVAAVVVAVAAWLVSPQFQSYDPPGDFTRAFWSAVAGALWPLVVVGAVQILAVRYFARRLRPAYFEPPEAAPPIELCDVGLHS